MPGRPNGSAPVSPPTGQVSTPLRGAPVSAPPASTWPSTPHPREPADNLNLTGRQYLAAAGASEPDPRSRLANLARRNDPRQ